MMKKYIRNVVFVVLFLILFGMLFMRVTRILQYKVGENDTIGTFYKQKPDSIDVLFIGSSHVYRGYSPMEIWNERGITSYNLGTPSQTIPCSYYLIKEGIRTQHPKVIVMDTFGIWYDADYSAAERAHVMFDPMPLNKNKLELLHEFLAETMSWKDRISFVLPITLYHGRWGELKKSDFEPKNQFLRGYQYTLHANLFEKPEPVKSIGKVYDRAMLYMNKIIELCKKNNVELLMTVLPMTAGDIYDIGIGKSNAIVEECQKKGIPCVDYNMLADEIGLDFSADFYSDSHLNAIGGKKVSSHMAEYLAEHYNLKDYRGESTHIEWQEDYKKYKKYQKKMKKSEKSEDGM